MSQIKGYLKGKSSLIIFDRHSNLNYKYESHFDSDELLNHKSAVDSLVNAEAAAIATGSVSAVSAVVAVITAPTGVGPIVGVLLALGFGIGCAYSIWNMYQQRDISDFHFGLLLL